MTTKFLAKIKFSDNQKSARSIDANGYLIIRDCPLSREGVFDYGLYQVNPNAALEGIPNRLVRVYRSLAQIKDPEYIASFERAPIIDDHDFLTGADGEDGTPPENKGVSGVLTNVHFDEASGWLVGDVTIYSQQMIADIENGKTELSLGFVGDIEAQTGVFEGQEYEFVQVNMRGNHLALVEDARIKGARILDAADQNPQAIINEKEIIMVKKVKTLDSAIEQLQALIPALKEFLQQEAGEEAHQTGDEGEGEKAKTGDADEGEGEKAKTGDADEDEGEKAKTGDADEGEGEKAKTGDADEDEGEKAKTGDADEGEQKPQFDAEAFCGLVNSVLEALGKGAGVKTGDAALKSFYADSAAKIKLYDQASELIGAFDHESMTHAEMVKYVGDKLEIPGASVQMLDAYFLGIGHKAKSTAAKFGDSAENKASVGIIADYLNGK